MKIVVLLAGKGRRLGELTRHRHKAFTKLGDKTLLTNLLETLEAGGAEHLVPVLGYDGDDVLDCTVHSCSASITVTPAYNPRFGETNNLYSLRCAREHLEGDDFVVCNGDLVMSHRILARLLRDGHGSSVCLDDTHGGEIVDSPRTIVRDGRIYDLGRHIPHEESGGYAIGLYKFGREMFAAFFDEADRLLAENLDAGFHDPLRMLYNDWPVYSCSTRGELWTDIDTKEDIPRANEIRRLIVQQDENSD